MASTQGKTPVQSHPLSPEESPPRSRRNRGDTTGARPATNYFTLKAQLEQGTSEPSTWDGAPRSYEKRRTIEVPGAGPSATATTLWEKPASTRTPPLFIVGSPHDRITPHVRVTADTDGDEAESALSNHILATQWHTYSDEAIQATITKLGAAETPEGHPYHTALRVLSSAVYNLSRVRIELEEARRVLQEKERAKRARAQELLNELIPSEQDIARRVIQSLFTNDDEDEHKVQRKQSVLVRNVQIYRVRANTCPVTRRIARGSRSR